MILKDIIRASLLYMNYPAAIPERFVRRKSAPQYLCCITYQVQLPPRSVVQTDQRAKQRFLWWLRCNENRVVNVLQYSLRLGVEMHQRYIGRIDLADHCLWRESYFGQQPLAIGLFDADFGNRHSHPADGSFAAAPVPVTPIS